MSMTTFAQDEVETTVSGDVVSSYIWRGLDLGSTAIQPTLGVGYKGLSLTAWGSYGIANPEDTKEFDLTLGYSLGGFNIGVTDYWFSTGLISYSRLDCHGRCRSFRHDIVRHDGLCRDQPHAEGLEGHQGHRLVLHPCLRTGHWKPLFTKSLSGLRLHTAAVALPKLPTPLPPFATEGFFVSKSHAAREQKSESDVL